MEELKDYSAYLSGKNDTIISTRFYTVENFIQFQLRRGKDYLHVSLNDADEYKLSLSTAVMDNGKNYHRGTINNKLRYLKDFYRYLEKAGKVFGNPFAETEFVKSDDTMPKNILNEDEIGKLFAGITVESVNDVVFLVLCEILYSCGLRISEAEGLKTENILFDRGLVLVKDAKTKKERYTPASEYCLSLIRLYLDEIRSFIASGEYLFPQNRGKTTLRAFVNRNLKSLCRSLKLKKVTSHSFRHSMATHLLKNGAGLREVQMILGHAKIRNTEIYTRVAKEDLKRIVKEKHPREKLFDGRCGYESFTEYGKGNLSAVYVLKEVSKKYFKKEYGRPRKDAPILP